MNHRHPNLVKNKLSHQAARSSVLKSRQYSTVAEEMAVMVNVAKELHQPISALHALSHKIRYEMKQDKTEKLKDYVQFAQQHLEQSEKLMEVLRYLIKIKK